MPSFLTKVFGRKKHDDKEGRSKRDSDPPLLEGKFEAVSTNLSPTASNFTEGVSKDSDGGFSGLFRSKSRPAPTSPSVASSKRVQELPHLSLNLPGPKEEKDSRALGVVFEADPDGRFMLEESVIGARRLNPLETLILVRACSQSIINRGLETLGIMHPHWYSASPEIQRKLISLFIHSLAPNSPITTLTPTPSATATAFESEINFTRSPHDVAAVLRWGLRHLKLDGATLGKSVDWYKEFSEIERNESYPQKAFSNALVPRLPPAHVELLIATLEVVSSLAAHAEHNGISGSKLTKFLGLWLLVVERTEEEDDWEKLYGRWERAGRMLEHLFLARIRNEAVGHRMPTRLLELVNHYPYTKGGARDSTDDGLLTRPRFSTRRYPALFVRIEAELPSMSTPAPKPHPLRLIAEAFKAETGEEELAEGAAWVKIKAVAVSEAGAEPGHPVLSRVFADDTIRLLSLIPAENAGDESEATTPTITLTPVRPTRRRSFSLSDANSGSPSPTTPNAKTNGNGAGPPSAFPAHGKAASAQNTVYSADWAQFSTVGFGENTQPLAATLLDTDVEVTQPPPSRKSSRKRKATSWLPPSDPSTPATPKVEESVKLVSKTTHASLIQLDEAFVDFWSDALLDPISAGFPAFVICKLKAPLSPLSASPDPVETGKSFDWLIIEQKFTRPAPPAPPAPTPQSNVDTGKARPSSPRPSFRSDISALRLSSTFSATRKRFSFFSGSQTDSSTTTEKGRKKVGKSPNIGEMGEILSEEDGVEAAAKENGEEKSAKKEANGRTVNGGEATKSNALGIVGVGVAAAAVTAAVEESREEPAAVPSSIVTPKESKPAAPAPPPVENPTISTSNAAPPVPAKDATVPADGADIQEAISASNAEKTKEIPANTSQPEVAVVDQTEPVAVVEATPEPPAQSSPATHETAESAKSLPPAPEPVILSGETPGPQIALGTSEPAAIAKVEAESEVSPGAEEPPERIVVEDPTEPTATTPVAELEPVPIVETAPPSEEPQATLTDPEEVQSEAEAPVSDPVAPTDAEVPIVEELTPATSTEAQVAEELPVQPSAAPPAEIDVHPEAAPEEPTTEAPSSIPETSPEVENSTITEPEIFIESTDVSALEIPPTDQTDVHEPVSESNQSTKDTVSPTAEVPEAEHNGEVEPVKSDSKPVQDINAPIPEAPRDSPDSDTDEKLELPTAASES